jgi:hypothetical protein
MITPTPGRVVWFHPGTYFQGRVYDRNQPLAGHIAHVFDDRMVNLLVIDSDGFPCSAKQVPLMQDDDAPPEDPTQSWAEWMPYQKGQAAKTEQLEQKLGGSA